MRLSIISDRPNKWHHQELLKNAKKLGFQASIYDILPTDIPQNLDKKLGDVVVWRSSSLDRKSERTALLGYLENKIVINDSVFRLPLVAHKYFQQNYLKAHRSTASLSIPTFRVKTAQDLQKLIKEGSLKLPFIAKPNIGAEGRGVLLISSAAEVKALDDLEQHVFQNFISNDGDWRVIVVGGTPLGAMKRIAAKGSYLNNISQGANATLETDEAVLSTIYKMATKVASLFHLTFCGVDIIRDQKTGAFHVLEVNTVPAWDEKFGFQAMTGVNVPAKVMEFAKERSSIKVQKLASDIEQYYKNRITIHFSESFHFSSRLWLWTGDTWARSLLNAQEQKFIGKTQDETIAILKKILLPSDNKEIVNQRKLHRQTSFEKYPMLSKYIAILFKTIFAQTVYGRDIRPLVKKQIPDKDFLLLFDKLVKDEDAIRLLSTHAVNYFYLLKNYFRDDLSKKQVTEFSPTYLLSLLPGYKGLEDKELINRETSIKLQVYLLTHAIIGQSGFYARPIEENVYKRLCSELETIIKNNFFEVSLDNKLEFLVCAALCGYKSELGRLINDEAKQSVSWAGNFIVDTMNATAGSKTAHCLRSSEHRNVLYLMSQKPFKKSGKSAKSSEKTEISLKKTIGSFEKVSFPDFNLIDVIAKIDTGATTGSLHATEITEIDLPTGEKALRFLPYGKKPSVIVKSYKYKMVRSSSGETSMRYVIPTTIVFGGVQYPIRLTLADRTPMKKGILIGRRFLRSHGFVVDVKKGTKYRGEVKT